MFNLLGLELKVVYFLHLENVFDRHDCYCDFHQNCCHFHFDLLHRFDCFHLPNCCRRATASYWFKKFYYEKTKRNEKKKSISREKKLNEKSKLLVNAMYLWFNESDLYIYFFLCHLLYCKLNFTILFEQKTQSLFNWSNKTWVDNTPIDEPKKKKYRILLGFSVASNNFVHVWLNEL